MKAWIAKGATGLGVGLGKTDVLVVPRQNGNSLVVKVAADRMVWIESEEWEGQPNSDDPLEEVEISEKLVEEINFSFDVKNGDLTQHAKNLLIEFVASAGRKEEYGMERVVIVYPESMEVNFEMEMLPFCKQGYEAEWQLTSREMTLTNPNGEASLETLFTIGRVQAIRKAGCQIEYFYSEDVEKAIVELGERATGFLADIFLVKEGVLAVVINYEDSQDQGIALSVDDKRLGCGLIPKGGIVKALLIAYDNIFAFIGIPESVEAIEDNGSQFVVSLAPVH